ncbi:MAG TPA: hypothetical protein VLF94_00880 [Chlamydiales bacterium]|nr:hypothetical protein [Chlamydiales bacterium]
MVIPVQPGVPGPQQPPAVRPVAPPGVGRAPTTLQPERTAQPQQPPSVILTALSWIKNLIVKLYRKICGCFIKTPPPAQPVAPPPAPPPAPVVPPPPTAEQVAAERAAQEVEQRRQQYGAVIERINAGQITPNETLLLFQQHFSPQEQALIFYRMGDAAGLSVLENWGNVIEKKTQKGKAMFLRDASLLWPHLTQRFHQIMANRLL